MMTVSKNHNRGKLDGVMVGDDNCYVGERKPCDRSRWVSLKMNNLLEGFTATLVRDDKSAATIRKYVKDLRQFLKEKGLLHIDDITRETIQDWILTLRTVGKINTALFSILAYYFHFFGVRCQIRSF
jgi:hypothetical protein